MRVKNQKAAIFGEGFGRITDIEVGPDGFLYILSRLEDKASIFRIVPRIHY